MVFFYFILKTNKLCFLKQYTEAALIAKPVIYISLQEICDTHKLLLENVDVIAPDKKDKLRELLEDLVTISSQLYFHSRS